MVSHFGHNELRKQNKCLLQRWHKFKQNPVMILKVISHIMPFVSVSFDSFPQLSVLCSRTATVKFIQGRLEVVLFIQVILKSSSSSSVVPFSVERWMQIIISSLVRSFRLLLDVSKHSRTKPQWPRWWLAVVWCLYPPPRMSSSHFNRNDWVS